MPKLSVGPITAHIETPAVREDNYYIISGAKRFQAGGMGVSNLFIKTADGSLQILGHGYTKKEVPGRTPPAGHPDGYEI